MNVLNRSTTESISLTTVSGSNRLSLYDQYGSVAYGVILQIVPQPQHAQEILVDLFASPELQANLPISASTTCFIIRQARAFALEYRQKEQIPVYALPEPVDQSEHIFNLLFYHNQSPDSIAERLQIQRPAVFRSVREFFGSILPS